MEDKVNTTDSRLSNARPASDVYSWAKASSKPSYSYAEVGAAPASHSHDYIPTSASCNKNWSWSGQDDQPSWLWGTNDGSNCYVWNPSNFSVKYATNANSSINAGYAKMAGDASTLDGNRASAFASASHSHDYLPLLTRELKLGRENGSDDLALSNGSFYRGGWWLGSLLNNNIVILTFNIDTNKSSTDWFFQLKNGLRPCRRVYFSYYLGSQSCRGYISTDGYVFFETLNTVDTLSATVIFPIA